MKLAIRLGIPGKCAAAERTTNRFHSCALHCPSSGKRAVVKHRARFENLARPERRNDRVVILHRVKQLIFIQDISFENGKSFTFDGDIFGRTNERSHLMTSREGLLNDFLASPASCFNDE